MGNNAAAQRSRLLDSTPQGGERLYRLPSGEDVGKSTHKPQCKERGRYASTCGHSSRYGASHKNATARLPRGEQRATPQPTRRLDGVIVTQGPAAWGSWSWTRRREVVLRAERLHHLPSITPQASFVGSNAPRHSRLLDSTPSPWEEATGKSRGVATASSTPLGSSS
ncbi:hypothetical protein B0H12DRAFT_1237624 [Mycena haematopus]|nr:hypothetical protein B0H12DRAFT_1237624 [Mycena haematopus]